MFTPLLHGCETEWHYKLLAMVHAFPVILLSLEWLSGTGWWLQLLDSEDRIPDGACTHTCTHASVTASRAGQTISLPLSSPCPSPKTLVTELRASSMTSIDPDDRLLKVLFIWSSRCSLLLANLCLLKFLVCNSYLTMIPMVFIITY